MGLSSKIGKALALLLFVFLFGVIGFMKIENWSFTDSVYMTIITMSTVGFREVHPLSELGRWHVIFLIIFSIGTLAIALNYITYKIVETKYFFRRKMEKSISKLKDHYIIAGYGRMGKIICGELGKKKEKYVVIERDPDVVQHLNEQGVSTILGDVTEDGVLTSAGLKYAKGLLTVVDSDADNVYCTLTARSLNDDLFIVARSETDRGTANLLRSGANKVINPYDAGGHAMAQVLLKPSAVELIELTTGSEGLGLEIDEIIISDKSSLIGKTIASSNIRDNYNVLIAGIKRSDGVLKLNPSSDEVISKGDILIALGEPDQITKLETLESEN